MHAYNDLLWAVFGWTTAGRVIMYGKSECKVNTNVFNVYLFNTIFIYYYPPQSTAGSTSLQRCSRTAACRSKEGEC